MFEVDLPPEKSQWQTTETKTFNMDEIQIQLTKVQIQLDNVNKRIEVLESILQCMAFVIKRPD